MSRNFYFLMIIGVIYGTVIAITIFSLLLPVFGQTNKTPPITPVPTNAPTPTSPNPNFQYLPQKAAVQVYTPEVGVPVNPTALQTVPQVIPAPVQQQSISGIDTNTMMSILAMITSAGSGFLGKLGFDKAKKAQDTGRENAAMNVKQAIVQEEGLKLQYDDMGKEKSDAITDRPEIRLTELAKMKDKAVETATKA